MRRLALILLLMLGGCTTLRAPQRPPVPEPLPLTAGVCPGPFNDYGGEGRHLLRAVRERKLFRDVVAMPASGAAVDLLLVPAIDAPRAHPMVGVLTLVPWAATATVFPWVTQASHAVQVHVHGTGGAAATCQGLASPGLSIQDAPRRRTTIMMGWTAPLLMLLPRWESGQVHEFRPAVDSLVGRREELLRLSGAPR